jgi:hypothetical protein
VCLGDRASPPHVRPSTDRALTVTRIPAVVESKSRSTERNLLRVAPVTQQPPDGTMAQGFGPAPFHFACRYIVRTDRTDRTVKKAVRAHGAHRTDTSGGHSYNRMKLRAGDSDSRIFPLLELDWQLQIDQSCLEERQREHVARMHMERGVKRIAAALLELDMRAVAPAAKIWAKVDLFEQAIHRRDRYPASSTPSHSSTRCWRRRSGIRAEDMRPIGAEAKSVIAQKYRIMVMMPVSVAALRHFCSAPFMEVATT